MEGAEIFMEGGGNFEEGAEILDESVGNLREVVGRRSLYLATNEQGLGHNQQYASALVKHYHRNAMYCH